MKANKLRIGSYINFLSVDKGILLSKVTELKNNYITVVLENGVSRENKECFQFTPLTEEWILKAGYLKKNGYGYSHYNIYGILLKNDTGFEFRYYGISIQLDFVHQLQNLYFSFYDEELVFSTEP